MRTSTKLKLGYLALAGLDTWLSGARPDLQRLRVATKPLLMPTLAASLATNPSARTSPLFASTLAAQAFGWGGDIGLLGKGTRPFLTGAASFGVGHLAYTAGFRRVANQRPLLELPVARAVLTAGALSGPTVGLAAARKEAALGLAIPAYSALLTMMTAHSANLDPAQPRLARQLTLAGAVGFLASDTILGVRKFVLPSSPPWVERTVMATYTAGQLLLSEGAARAR